MPTPVVVAEVVRSGFVEGHHYGSAIALAADGVPAWSVGAVDAPVLPRSCNKPLQAVAMVRMGLELPQDLVALACASHSGEDFHLEGVRRILSLAGLGEGDLQTPPGFPLDDMTREQFLRDGGAPMSIAMNCSGKHAAMLATCVVNGWDTRSYLSPDHPLQQGILDVFAELTRQSVGDVVVAVDGCGAPLFSTSLTGLAAAFGTVAASAAGSEHQVAEAIRRHPAQVSGSRRDERTLLAAIPGAIGKAGAESSYALALPDGRAFAIKTDDGAPRAWPVVLAEMLRRTGVLDEPGVDRARVEAACARPLLGGLEQVGEVRALLDPG